MSDATPPTGPRGRKSTRKPIVTTQNDLSSRGEDDSVVETTAATTRQIPPLAFAEAEGLFARDDVQGATIGLIRMTMPVRWRDLDAFNHVNNSTYLSYLEEARLQWMLTVPGHGMDEHVAPVVAAAHLNYRRPIEWPNDVAIELFVERLGNTSVSIGHRIVAANDADVLYCDGNVVMVWIDRGSGRAAPLPAAVRRSCSPA